MNWATTILFAKITLNAEGPETCKVEQTFPLHKTEKLAPVMSEYDVQTISKLLESLLGDWLLHKVEPYLDSGQCSAL